MRYFSYSPSQRSSCLGNDHAHPMKWAVFDKGGQARIRCLIAVLVGAVMSRGSLRGAESPAGPDAPPLPTTAASPGKVRPVATSEQDLKKMTLEELTKVNVSPFDVSTKQDKGYRTPNSVSGSRLNTPIQQLPFAIQAFTADFIDDQRPQNIFDVARYSPAVTYRSNDFNEGDANTSIR